ncbi:hypothetical protein [Sanguibacter gelidistatuariae]|nr:hypothetical protein [Sanguibacter gelidistatuariae]
MDEVVRSPRSTVLDPTALQQALDSARGRVHIEGREGDGAHYRVALMLLFVLGQLYLIDNPAPIAGAPWNFTATSGTGTGHHVIRSVLAEPIGIWRTDPKEGTAELVDAATDLLVRGFDSPSLRVLAGTSPREPQAVVGPILTSTLGELGVDDLLRVSADRAGLVARLRRFLDGRLTLRELSFWAHCEIDHDGDPDCQAFVDLDDLYNDWEYAGLDVVRLEAIARREARAFLDGSRPASFDEFWPWLPAAPRRDFFAWWRTVFRRRRAD